MAAQANVPPAAPPPAEANHHWASLLKKVFKKGPPSHKEPGESRPPSPSALMRKVGRKVVPGLPRAKTFKRQQSEVREKLEPILPTSAERRAVSVDRRLQSQRNASLNRRQPFARGSAPDFLDETQSVGPRTSFSPTLSQPRTPANEKEMMGMGNLSNPSIETSPPGLADIPTIYTHAPSSTADIQSMTTSQYDALINDELENTWILNLSMHFRDKSKREKFFVTYRENESMWRRVTISLDYRTAPEDSLERDLLSTKYQRDKSAKIYEAIRESLQDIQFYETVTNLKLQTTDGRLHVHVVEDVNEIIPYPTVPMVQHLKCHRVRERDIQFDSHMSGFVYKVRVGGRPLIKKEIPGPDTVEEFLYEVNALNYLGFSRSVIEFFGVVIDDENHVKGLLISYAEKGALIDVIYDSQEHELSLPWPTREKWAKQIVRGLADIHESGFVQGDFTLSNIVIDRNDNAKIIDINRRGCPVGWEPPEATPLIESSQRISMYIGVKSDLYQLGMVLWALAMLEDEPEAHGRPLRLDPEIEIPSYYRRIVAYCLHEDPRVRRQAKELLDMFPEEVVDSNPNQPDPSTISVDFGNRLQEYLVSNIQQNGPRATVVEPQDEWPYPRDPRMSPAISEPDNYPPRGRSPPRPLPSGYDPNDTRYLDDHIMWPQEIDAFSGMEGSNLHGAADEAPREVSTTQDIEAQVTRDLRDLEAGLQGGPADELARAAGSESRTTEAALETNRLQVSAKVSGKAKENSAPTEPGVTDFLRRDNQTAVMAAKPQTAQSQDPSLSGTNTNPASGGSWGTIPEGQQNESRAEKKDGNREKNKGKGKVETAAGSEQYRGEGLEIKSREPHYHYTHGQNEATPPRIADLKSHPSNEPRSRESPAAYGEPNHDLTGVGAVYDRQAEFGRPEWSDDDLSLAPSLTRGVSTIA